MAGSKCFTTSMMFILATSSTIYQGESHCSMVNFWWSHTGTFSSRQGSAKVPDQANTFPCEAALTCLAVWPPYLHQPLPFCHLFITVPALDHWKHTDHCRPKDLTRFAVLELLLPNCSNRTSTHDSQPFFCFWHLDTNHLLPNISQQFTAVTWTSLGRVWVISPLWSYWEHWLDKNRVQRQTCQSVPKNTVTHLQQVRGGPGVLAISFCHIVLLKKFASVVTVVIGDTRGIKNHCGVSGICVISLSLNSKFNLYSWSLPWLYLFFSAFKKLMGKESLTTFNVEKNTMGLLWIFHCPCLSSSQMGLGSCRANCSSSHRWALQQPFSLGGLRQVTGLCPVYVKQIPVYKSNQIPFAEHFPHIKRTQHIVLYMFKRSPPPPKGPHPSFTHTHTHK